MSRVDRHASGASDDKCVSTPASAPASAPAVGCRTLPATASSVIRTCAGPSVMVADPVRVPLAHIKMSHRPSVDESAASDKNIIDLRTVDSTELRHLANSMFAIEQRNRAEVALNGNLSDMQSLLVHVRDPEEDSAFREPKSCPASQAQHAGYAPPMHIDEEITAIPAEGNYTDS